MKASKTENRFSKPVLASIKQNKWINLTLSICSSAFSALYSCHWLLTWSLNRLPLMRKRRPVFFSQLSTAHNALCSAWRTKTAFISYSLKYKEIQQIINQSILFYCRPNEHLQHRNKQCINKQWHIQLGTIGKSKRDHGRDE